jgi:hypothetical protein
MNGNQVNLINKNMWIKCKFDDNFEYTINLENYGLFAYENESKTFYIKMTEWQTIKLKHITAKQLSLHIEKLINDNFNGVLIINEELENLIDSKFPSLEEFNNINK